MSYGNALKEQRESFGYTQSALSKATGISQPKISYYESGTHTPPIDLCVILSKFYGISIDELVGIADTPVVSSPASPKKKQTIEFVDDFEELMSDRNFVNIAKLCKAISPELRAVTLGYVIGLLQANHVDTRAILG